MPKHTTSLVLTTSMVKVFGSSILAEVVTIQPVSVCLTKKLYVPADRPPKTFEGTYVVPLSILYSYLVLSLAVDVAVTVITPSLPGAQVTVMVTAAVAPVISSKGSTVAVVLPEHPLSS